MFKIDKQAASYTWPVTVQKPVDGGRFQKGTFTAEFVYLEQPDIDQVLENARLGRDNGDLCARAWSGWKTDLVGEDGAALPYSEESKAMLLAIPYVRGAVLAAFVESINGEGARRKNS